MIVAPHLEIVEFEVGKIFRRKTFFYIVYHGVANLRVRKRPDQGRTKTLSGEMFDLKYLGMFSEESVFETHQLNCTSEIKSKLFRFS
jgi:hypothetical protein